MRYTEEQLSEIVKRISALENRLTNLDKFEADSLRERRLIKEELTSLNSLLLDKPIEEKDSDTIELGSKFRLTLESEEYGSDTDDYIMSDTNIKVPGFITITHKSPLGFAVFGKEVGEKFEYKVNGLVNKGYIEEIYKVKKEMPKEKTIEK